ncbi:MAG: DsbA family protein [Alphaproteobacteria bacterium]
MTQVMRLAAAAFVLLFIAGTASAQDKDWASGALIMGDPDAPVTMVEYASMTCPHCAAFHTGVLKDIKEKYIDTGKVKLEFREFPFDALGLRAAMLARCAGPNRVFGMLDVLFKQQLVWSRSQNPMAELGRLGKLGGVSQSRFDACMQNQELADVVLANRLEGQEKMQVESTPTFFINGDKVSGTQALEVYEKAIEKHLP